MDYTASSCCSEMTVVSDNDSAFSSEGPRDSECSCDSCLCDLSFSTLGSDMSAINPFGSFKHSGALPHSVFEDSNSFAMSPVSEKTRSYTDCENSIFHDSTHVYMNLLERSMMTEVKATKFWTSQAGWDETLLSSRPDCEGTEDQTMIEEIPTSWPTVEDLTCPRSTHILTKVDSWLQTCNYAEPGTSDGEAETEQPSSVSIDSDTSSFMTRPLSNNPVTTTIHAQRRQYVLQQLRKLGRFLRKARHPKKNI